MCPKCAPPSFPASAAVTATRRSDGSILKLWRTATGRSSVEREAAALLALADHPGLAPPLRGRVEIDGRPGLVIERVVGGGLAAQLRSRPWSVSRTVGALARCHASIHAVPAPRGLPSLKDDLRRRIEASGQVPSDLARTALTLLDALPDGDRLCHGDFHVANILGTVDRPVVIDWPNATCGDPDADVAHTNVLHRFGRPREGTNRLERTVANIGRGVFGSRYLSAYRKIRPLDNDRLARWERVRATARLTTGVPAEREKLIRFLQGV